MTTTRVSFKQIKADVAIEQVLERYGVHLRRVGGELRRSCPLPTHTSRRSRDSFSVSPARNAWSCRSAVLYAGAWWEGWREYPGFRRGHGGLLRARRGAPAPRLERNHAAPARAPATQTPVCAEPRTADRPVPRRRTARLTRPHSALLVSGFLRSPCAFDARTSGDVTERRQAFFARHGYPSRCAWEQVPGL